MEDKKNDFDVNKLIADMSPDLTKKTISEGVTKLKELIFTVFDHNADLNKEENIAFTKDTVMNASGYKYDNLIDLWYDAWVLQRKRGG